MNGERRSGALSPAVRLLLALGLAGLLAGFLWGVADVPRYSASASVVLAAKGGGDADPADLQRLAELGGSREVATEAAGLLGGDVAGADLLSDVSFRVPEDAGSVRAVAVADDPGFAVAAADAFAEALVLVGPNRAALGEAAALPDGPSENRSAVLWSAIGLLGGLLVAGLLLLFSSRRSGSRPSAVEEQRPDPGDRFAPPGEPARLDVPEPGEPLPAERAFGVPVLASFGDPADLVFRDDDALRVAEPGAGTFDELAESLALDSQQAPRTVAVLDVAPGDGAEQVLLGLAVAVGRMGLSVLIVEADLSRASLAERAAVAPVPGLCDYLQGRSGPRDVLRRFRAEAAGEEVSLVCVPAGERPDDLPEGIGGARFDALVERLPRVYDLVLFAGPPVSLDGDAVTVAEAVDGVVLVSADDEQAGDRIAGGVESIAGATLLAGVLTRPAGAQSVPQARF